MPSEWDEYLERARREMFPKVKSAALTVTILGEPDPKLCLELGAAILFDKPILVVVPPGRPVPLALRTIANKIVEVDLATGEGKEEVARAIAELVEAGRYRGGKRKG